MIKNWKALFAAAALSLTMFGAGAAFTSQANAQVINGMRGEYGSARNIVAVRRRLEGLIDQLQRDQHDYDGHRVAAINAMIQARTQLDAAINWDASHRH